MKTSDNGWPGIEDRAELVTSTVRGTNELRFQLAPKASWILTEFAARFNDRVEKLDGQQLDDWSYAWRPVRGSTSNLSCHASGTAIDLNATRHPRGVRGTFGGKVADVRKLLAEFVDPLTNICVIKWGKDFVPPSLPDEMHFQINGFPAMLARVRERLEDDVTPDDIKKIAEAVWEWDGIPNQGGPADNPNWTGKSMLSDIEATQDRHTLILQQILDCLKAK